MIFLKGYQWPFDVRKVPDGSSVIDLLVHEETVKKGRRVWLDFRANTEGLDFAALSDEARTYLEKSGACFGTPLERLEKMNPGAIELYRDHNIDLAVEPLEIAVCAQHNNGGLAGNVWYESPNLKHLFPVGEVNGSHGVCRPGGTALNARAGRRHPRGRIYRRALPDFHPRPRGCGTAGRKTAGRSQAAAQRHARLAQGPPGAAGAHDRLRRPPASGGPARTGGGRRAQAGRGDGARRLSRPPTRTMRSPTSSSRSRTGSTSNRLRSRSPPGPVRAARRRCWTRREN